MPDKVWYVISTQGIGSRGVVKIQAILDTLNYEGMLWTPIIKVHASTTTKKITNKDTILFPNYVFIHAAIDDSKLEQALVEGKVGKFLKLPGDTLPTAISEADIEHIRTLEESNAQPTPTDLIAIELGNLVEICVGPLIGFKGIVSKISGHSASIDTLIFGRSTPVSVNIAHLTKLTENNSNEENTN